MLEDKIDKLKTNGGKKNAVIIGAGPAGLTAAFELLNQTSIHPIIFEETNEIGGISRTVRYNGNHIDIGPHRFFSKCDEIMDWWGRMLPVQGHPSVDDKISDREKKYKKDGPDPETNTRVMLIRRRFTRIFYLKKFFDYPISLKLRTFINMGFFNSVNAGFGYIWALCFKRKEVSLEDFYINRFGRPLYEMFFENYTKKVWGVHPSVLTADWGSQRVKDISLSSVLENMVGKSLLFKNIKGKRKVDLSLIEHFLYPKFGAGQMWETVANEIAVKGGEINKNQKVCKINIEGNRVVSVVVNHDEIEETTSCDCLFSSMSLSELLPAFRGIDIPQEILDIATELPYRGHITVGILVDELIPENNTGIKTINNIIPDNWIYVQEKNVKMGRLFIINNFSPYMVEDYLNKVLIGVEYFCDDGDELWNMDEQSFISMAINELEKIQIIKKENVIDSFQVKVKKAYPSYSGSYYQLDKVITFLNKIENLYCIGRNGQHRYNNMDHSMLTAIEAVKHLASNTSGDKSIVWNVNTEKDYHESKY